MLEITGYKQVGDLEKCLKKQGIRFFYGKPGVIWTTLSLIEAAGGLKPVNDNQKPEIL